MVSDQFYPLLKCRYINLQFRMVWTELTNGRDDCDGVEEGSSEGPLLRRYLCFLLSVPSVVLDGEEDLRLKLDLEFVDQFREVFWADASDAEEVCHLPYLGDRRLLDRLDPDLLLRLVRGFEGPEQEATHDRVPDDHRSQTDVREEEGGGRLNGCGHALPSQSGPFHVVHLQVVFHDDQTLIHGST